MDVKKITDTFTLAVPVLVVCSCIRLITYYQHWNIPILDYLSASELVLLFIQPVLVIAGLAAIYLAFNLGLAGAVLMLVQLGVWKGSKESDTSSRAESSQPSKKTHPIYGWIITVVWIGMMVAFFFNGIWFDFEIVPTVLFHVFLLLGTAVAVRGLLPSAEKDDRTKPLATATIVVLISASFFFGRYQAHSTELHPSNVRIALKDQALLDTNANRIYLGKTSNYYFFHNPKDGETSIIPVGEVRATYVK